MGYNLYVTRSEDWSDENGPKISQEEWLAYVASDPELRIDESMGSDMAIWSGPSQHELPWIQWSDGLLESKYPDPPLIEKLVSVAAALAATVQGEEGERYLAGGVVHRRKGPGFFARARRWFENATAPEQPGIDPATLPFKVGDRVKDVWGREATITRMDLKADHGMGHIEIRYDNGHALSYAAIAHGLEPISRE